jgi:hypothetical protein
MKPLPISVKTAPALSVVRLLGEIPDRTGVGLLIVRVAAPEVPSPGPGLRRVICPLPPAARSAAVSAACNWVELTKVVARLLWFHAAVEFWMKPLPVIVTAAWGASWFVAMRKTPAEI